MSTSDQLIQPYHTRRAGLATRRWYRASALVLATALAACGGSGPGADSFPPSPATPNPTIPSPPAVPVPAPVTAQEAARFLTQATFGPTRESIREVVDLGYAGWIAKQFDTPRENTFASHIQAVLGDQQRKEESNPNFLYPAFYRQAITSKAQLRARVAFALSEIYVISTAHIAISKNIRGVARYHDLLHEHAFGNLRALLHDVSTHPTMGAYLSIQGSQKESETRRPDENYARELMQLFTIGLYQLNLDGTPRLDAAGRRIETYGIDDVRGLAKVFTGWEADNSRGYHDYVVPMVTRPAVHSTTEKRFLGVRIDESPATDASMREELRIALDTLFAHANVGPFIGRQLIQRLVTSNPSPAYVERVARAFNDNGRGVRGDMKAVVSAVLLDPEARATPAESEPASGKVREPVLALTAFLRAADCRSNTWLVRTNTSGSSGLAQVVYQAPSVFNFFRPGFVPSGTALAERNLVAPELQLVSETSVAAYSNFFSALLLRSDRVDLNCDLAVWRPLAAQPDALIDELNLTLAQGRLRPGTRDTIRGAVSSIELPPEAQPSQREAALRTRAQVASYLTLMSPEFLVQR